MTPRAVPTDLRWVRSDAQAIAALSIGNFPASSTLIVYPRYLLFLRAAWCHIFFHEVHIHTSVGFVKVSDAWPSACSR